MTACQALLLIKHWSGHRSDSQLRTTTSSPPPLSPHTGLILVDIVSELNHGRRRPVSGYEARATRAPF